MKELTATDLASLLAVRAELPKADDFYCFRGQSDCRWQLIPGMYRRLEQFDPRFSAEQDGVALGELERDSYRAFFLRSRTKVRDSGLGKLERLFLAQHWGAPTRLLDWTRVVTIAAYLAVWENSDVDGAIWCLHLEALPVPAALGRRPGKQGYPIAKLKTCVDLERLSFLLDDTQLPRLASGLLAPSASAIPSDQAGRSEWAGFMVGIEPPNVEARIKNQQGLFTIYLSYDDDDVVWNHADYLVAVEQQHQCELLTKIVIPAECKKELRESIERDAGIDPYFLFPDPAGLALLQQRERVARLERLLESRQRL